MKIGLVGCVKSKKSEAAPAKNLYVSPLFVGRRRCVERTCDRWFVLSALHGLVHPEQELEPYDRTLNNASVGERRRWSQQVLGQLEQSPGSLQGIEFEVHAGAAYLNFGLKDGLHTRRASVSTPTAGFPLGKQLALYAAGCHG